MVKATSKPALRLPTQGSSSFHMKEEGREFGGRRGGSEEQEGKGLRGGEENKLVKEK